MDDSIKTEAFLATQSVCPQWLLDCARDGGSRRLAE